MIRFLAYGRLLVVHALESAYAYLEEALLYMRCLKVAIHRYIRTECSGDWSLVIGDHKHEMYDVHDSRKKPSHLTSDE